MSSPATTPATTEKKQTLSVKHYKTLAFIQWYNNYLLENGLIKDTTLIDQTIFSIEPSKQINFINSFQDFESTHITNYKASLKSHIKTQKDINKDFNKFYKTHIQKNPHLFLPTLQHNLPNLDSQHFLTNPLHPNYHQTLKHAFISKKFDDIIEQIKNKKMEGKTTKQKSKKQIVEQVLANI